MMHRLELKSPPAAEDLAILSEGLGRHAVTVLDTPGFQGIAVMAHDEEGGVVGGAAGTLNWNWLSINLVWVHETRRASGLGSELLAAIEQAAVARGCTRAHLDTFSFQARPFYERHGYEVFATLEDYPPGQRRYYMKKRLR
jgi:GNAT superfamily N-acetyltransferase